MSSEQITLIFEEQLTLAAESKRQNQKSPKLRKKRNRPYEINRWDDTNKLPDIIQPTLVSGDSHTCKTRFEQLEPISLCDMQLPKVHEGRYLVCKSIATPFNKVSTNTLIEDLNDEVEKLELHNFRYDITDSYWLKNDIIIVIKEPYLCYGKNNESVIIVYSPSDVIFVDSTDLGFLKKIGAQKWFDKTSTADVEEIRKVGNEYFMQKDYDNALYFYDRAIRYNPELAVLYLNKSATCLRSGYFQLAYQTAKIGMEKGGDREKGLHRLGLASYGLRDWNRAIENFKMLLKDFPTNKEAKKELKRAKERLRESKTGEFDFKKLYLGNKNGTKEFDIADYKLPSIEIQEIPGKGRGIVATKLIQKGTLLLVAKAFACGYEEHSSTPLMVVNLIQKQTNNFGTRDDAAAKFIIIRAIENLKKNPLKAKEVYALYSGNSLMNNESIPEGVIDTALIEKVIVYNKFGCDATQLDPTTDNERDMLFLTPSYFNHSCIANAHRAIYGDIMVVYATTTIKEGDEISIPYRSAVEPYLERKTSLLKIGSFECKCRLCEIDKIDENCEKRAGLLEKLKHLFIHFQNPTKGNSKKVVSEGELILKQIRDAYKNRTELKIDLAYALSLMIGIYYAANRSKLIVKYLEEVIELTDEELEIDIKIPKLLVNLSMCYSALNQEEKAKKTILKAFKMSFCVNKEHFKAVYSIESDLF